MGLRPGNHDRAWNDPPMLNAPSSSTPQDSLPGVGIPAAAPVKRTLLNKRVAFPMSGPATPVTNQNAAVNISPPSYLPAAGPPPASLPLTSPPNGSQFSYISNQPPIPVLLPPLITPEQDQTLRLERLASFMSNIRVKLVDVDHLLEDKTKEDIQRCLQALETIWQERKFNLDLENRLELKDGQLAVAETLLGTLETDYASVTANWAIGLKQLISTAQNLNVSAT